MPYKLLQISMPQPLFNLTIKVCGAYNRLNYQILVRKPVNLR